MTNKSGHGNLSFTIPRVPYKSYLNLVIKLLIELSTLVPAVILLHSSLNHVVPCISVIEEYMLGIIGSTIKKKL